MSAPDLPEVREQYEAFPHPVRDLDDERTRLANVTSPRPD